MTSILGISGRLRAASVFDADGPLMDEDALRRAVARRMRSVLPPGALLGR